MAKDNVTASLSSDEQDAIRRQKKAAKKAAPRTSVTTGDRANPSSFTAPTVIAARYKAEQKLRRQQEAADKAARVQSHIETASTHPEFKSLTAGTITYRVAVEVLTQYVNAKADANGSRVWNAYQLARKELGITARQSKQRETNIWHGHQVANTALMWAYVQINSTTPAKELVDA